MFNFNPHMFLESLIYMGQGMVGIFAVIGIIIIVTAVLNRIFSRKKKAPNTENK